MNFFRNTLLAVCFISLSFGCQDISGTKTLKLGHGLNSDHPVHKGMEYMAQKLEEKSGGKLTMDIYPSEQLGSERQLLELLQIGSLAMTKVSAAVLENFAPTTKVLSLPYVFKDKAHSHKFYDSKVGKDLIIQGEDYWLRGLTYFDAGHRSFYTKERPVHSPTDLEGLKIRVQESVSALNLVRAMGAAPTPISWGELYTALQQGVVDGAENNPPSFFTSRHYEVCKFYTLNEHTAVPDVLIIGTVAWNNLNEQEQQWLQEAADEAGVHQRTLWLEAEQAALKAVQEAGVEIIRPDKEPFMAKTQELLEDFRSIPEIYEIIQQIQAL